jgi:cytochrome c oxidase subunit 2
MIRRVPWRGLAGAALAAVVLLVLSACGTDHPQTTIAQDGEANRRIWDVYYILWIGAAVVFVLVEGLLVFAIIRGRRRPRTVHGRPVPVHGNSTLEVVWTIIPAIVLVGIGIPTLQILADLHERPDDPNTIHVEVIARQFAFEFRYPELGIQSFGEMHIPTQTMIDLDLKSDDVIHSFWVPRLAGKTDHIPGRTNEMWLTADKPGEYAGQCAEFCGLGHAQMRFKVVAHDQADYDAWVQEKLNPQAGGDPEAGRALFMSVGCAGCHTIDGTEAKGTVGPNLTHIASQDTIAGVLENTPENLHAWIDNPQAHKPGTLMPDLGLSPPDIDNIVAYLETLE